MEFKSFGMKILFIGIFAILLLPILLIICWKSQNYQKFQIISIGEVTE